MNSGEHFRRTLNTQRTPRLGATTISTSQSIGRSLPYADIYGLQPHRSPSQALDVDVKAARKTTAGPIPRSWAAAATALVTVSESGPTWRATALSLFFTQSNNDLASAESPHGREGRRRAVPAAAVCPSLAECCLRVLLEHCDPLDADADVDVATLGELASYLAPHHRKQAVRMCAVRNPLSGARLRALLGEGQNHVEGELVLVEPASLLRPELFRARTHTAGRHGHGHGHGREGERGWGESGLEAPGQWDGDDAGADHSGSADAMPDWQEQEDEEQQPLTAVAIVSTTLSIPVLLAFPSSLTRLALIHLSAPIPVHRLPDKCPLLDFLDISYNPWLAEPAWGGERALERVAWGRWAYLKLLGCRECGVTSEELRKVNEGRWEDVMIVT